MSSATIAAASVPQSFPSGLSYLSGSIVLILGLALPLIRPILRFLVKLGKTSLSPNSGHSDID